LGTGLVSARVAEPGHEDPCLSLERAMRSVTEVVRDNPALGQFDLDAILWRPRLLRLGSLAVSLLGAIPENSPAVQLVVEHLADGARSPPMLTAAGRGDPFRIELLGDARDAPPIG